MSIKAKPSRTKLRTDLNGHPPGVGLAIKVNVYNLSEGLVMLRAHECI